MNSFALRTAGHLLLLSTVAFSGLAPDAAAQLLDGAFAAVEARNIGPAGMSGRVAAVAVDPTDQTRIFVGGATGGLFRSVDGGLTWEPVFDDERVVGIGSIAISPVDPEVVWVGTGEGNPRNSVGVGYGLYRSEDGGTTWAFLGLEGSERIHRVLAHPTDPDVAYIGAMGPAWSDGEERGVYRTTDGGRTLEKILYVDERTGVGDMVMDPSDPDRLLVGMWEYRREPWFFTSGGPGSGLFLTENGGDDWTELTASDGLPEGDLGRIGLAFARSDPDVAYALVEAERSALLRSEDGGRSWSTVSDRRGIAPRPFYYADIRVDPLNPDRIYSLHSSMQVSENRGEDFRTVVSSSIIHGDVHELWIDPQDSRHMIMGNDGGIGVTYDRGDNWRFVENLALAQFYRIRVDDETPYNVYGGLQDNGSWYGPSTVWENKGILNAHWFRVGGGDGFHVAPDPADDRFGYSMSQQGRLSRFSKVTGARWSIQPDHPEGRELRFNWNAGFALDPFDPATIYLGSQYVHRSPDQGATWDVISPDLTTNDPEKQRQNESGGLTIDATGAENHTTIIDIAPSPIEDATIWVGTDDGRVQLTRDDGRSWTDVGANIRGVPQAAWAADVQPSFHDAATAYAVFDEHRKGDWGTYVFRTEDYGETWARLPTEGVFGFAHDIAEDPETANLLFLGTEHGLNVSLDRGETWWLWTDNGLPPAPVRESVVHPTRGDLVVGTHGRAAWVVDDIVPLREIAADPAIVASGVHIFSPPVAYQVEVAEAIGYRSTGHSMFQAETRSTGALLTYWVGRGGSGEAQLEVRDDLGRFVDSFTERAEPGANRVVWNMRSGENSERPHRAGEDVFPGDYTVTVRFGGIESSAELEVRPDPRGGTATVAERMADFAAVELVDAWGELVGEAREQIESTGAALDLALEVIGGGDEELRREAEAVRESLASLSERLFEGRDAPARNVRAPLRRITSTPGAPTPHERQLMDLARRSTRTVVEEVNGLQAGDVQRLRESLVAAGFDPLPVAEPLRLPVGG